MKDPHLDNWNPPKKLGGSTLMKWPEGVFPSPFEEFVSELSRATETPKELAALMVLPTVATIAQRMYVVQVKADYREPLSIWTCVALPPGTRKSAVQSACTRPLSDFECKLKKELLPIRNEIDAKNQILDWQVRELKNKAGKVKMENIKAIQEEIQMLEDSRGQIPTFPQLWTSDVTPENLATIMAENQDCMSVLSDEGGIFDILAGRYSSGIPNLDLVLKAHAGTPCRINRRSQEPLFLKEPTLTMGLSPQPDVLKRLGAKKTFRGRGLLGRFLYALPKSNLGTRSFEEPPICHEVASQYNAQITVLAERAIQPGGNNKRLKPLPLTDDAYRTWQMMCRVLESQLEPHGEMGHMTDWGGKATGAIIRIAGLLHVMRYSHSSPENYPIENIDILSSIKAINFFCSHAKEVFDVIGENTEVSDARRILQWILDKSLADFTRRDCQRALRGVFPEVNQEFKNALNLLEEHGYILSVESGDSKRGRPSSPFLVNPWIHQRHNKN